MLLLLAVALEILADFALRCWSLRPGAGMALLGSLAYAGSGLAFGCYMRAGATLQRAIVLFAAGNLLAALLLGWACFGERPTPRLSAAALLALSAIILGGS